MKQLETHLEIGRMSFLLPWAPDSVPQWTRVLLGASSGLEND